MLTGNFSPIALLILGILHQSQAASSSKSSTYTKTLLDLSLIQDTYPVLVGEAVGPGACGVACSVDGSCAGFGYRWIPDHACLLIRTAQPVHQTANKSGHFDYYLLDGLSSACTDTPGVESGLQMLQLHTSYIIVVYCDKLAEEGVWLRFQNRWDGSENFYRNWEDYKAGFGKPWGEFWLGNDNLHQLTQGANHRLRIELEDQAGLRLHVTYTRFAVGDEASQYKLTVGGYTGPDPPGDSFGHLDGQLFTTFDVDNDERVSANCAVQFKGGWWYKSCHLANLNGLYDSAEHGVGISWRTWKPPTYSLPSVRMLLQRHD